MNTPPPNVLNAIQDEALRLLGETDIDVVREGLELIESMCRFGLDVRSSSERERTTASHEELIRGDNEHS